MDDFNKMFDAFPDYDIFDENSAEIGEMHQPKKRRPGNFDYIQYDEKKDFRNKVPRENFDEDYDEPEHSTEYRDDYGVYRVYEPRQKNFATIFFFPLVMLWLEGILRLACGQSLLSFNIIFITLFSLSFSAILTAVCTLFNEKLNRIIANILTAVLTVWYCVQIVSFNMTGEFILFSSYVPEEQTLGGFQLIMDTMSQQVYFLLACFFPFVLSLFPGKYVFPFRKIRIPAKICLVLAAVLLHFTAVTCVTLDRKVESDTSNYAIYHQETDSKLLQERFGLYTMQRMDFFN